MPQIPPLVDDKVIRPSETARALKLLGEFDLLRLKAIARLYSRGLPPDVMWEDLLQEALTRVLTGSRRPPEGVAVVAFVAGIMRSIKSEHWRRAARIDRGNRQSDETALSDSAPGPESALIARQVLMAIERLFAEDEVASRIILGLMEGLSAEQIRTASAISKTDYDSARKRMRRTLLREGLTCEPK